MGCAWHIVVNEQILVAVWSDSLLTESVTDVCHSICCPVLTMILLQDQFYDIIGKLDPDNLNQILIYHNSSMKGSTSTAKMISWGTFLQQEKPSRFWSMSFTFEKIVLKHIKLKKTNFWFPKTHTFVHIWTKKKKRLFII